MVGRQMLVQGSHASWKILESPGIFTVKFSGPGKSWKMTLVQESSGNLLARSWKVMEFARQLCTWQFLISNRHVYADENSHNCCHQVRFLGCWYAKNAFTSGVPPWTLLAELTALSQTTYLMFVAIFKHCWLTTGSWKNASGGLESPGILL